MGGLGNRTGDASGLSVTATGGTVARALSAVVADASNILAFGAICDGTSHPLSTKYATLAAAQVVFPQAVALTDEIDTCAIRLALAKTGAAFIPRTSGCMIGDLLLISGSGQRVYGRGSIVIPASGASRMIQIAGYANTVESLYVQDNGNLVAQTTLTAAGAAGATTLSVGTVASGPAVQVGQRLSLRLDCGSWFTTWITGVSGSTITLRDALPTSIIVAGVQTTVAAGSTVASVGNAFWATFGLFQITNGSRYVLRDIGGVNVWGGVLVDAPNNSISKGYVDRLDLSAGVRMFGLIKGRNASDNHFGNVEAWGGYYASVSKTGDGSTTTFALPEQVNLTRELTVSVGGSAKTAGTDYTIAANGLSVSFVAAPAAGATISFGWPAYGHDGLVDDGRDVTAATGGNYYHAISCLQFRRGIVLKGAQLFAFTGKCISDTCSEYAVVADATSQIGILDLQVGWASVISLWLMNAAVGVKSTEIVLSPQGAGYAVSGVTPIPVQIDAGCDLTGRVHSKGAGFTDYSGGAAAFTASAANVRSFVGTSGSITINPSGNTLGFSGQYGYIASAAANSFLSFRSAGTNGVLQMQATTTVKATIGSVDMWQSTSAGTTFLGTGGNFVIGASGDLVGYSKQGYNYFYANAANARLVLQSNGTNGVVQLDAKASARLTVNGVDTFVCGSGLAVTYAPLVNGSGVRTALTSSGYIVPAGTDLVRFTQASSVTASVTLPSPLADGQPIQFVNQGAGTATISFSPAVNGWTNGTTTLGAYSGARIRWDATAAAWYREQ
ncbi:hypothetical protein MKK84_27105 [Methylobacterium sp. E-065]|uniref:hypothetical protein n=1 Tax=Methylobacterium sp. E-065 TaxID=2836583 RepID=UPI001FBAA881|nr:hypothetical protein [Methylobacterium sp. E-065]MCJ2021047.1 hypothetical protein [Methylobacterium sp. E-065]